MNNLDKKMALDSYNIFDLMGLSSLSDQNKADMLYDMNSVIWNDFLSTRIDALLTVEQLQEVKRMLSEEKDVQSVMAFIQSQVPNFSQLLLEFSRDAKIKIMEEQFHNNISDLRKEIDLLDDEKKRENLSNKVDTYLQAVQFLEAYDWDGLKNIW